MDVLNIEGQRVSVLTLGECGARETFPVIYFHADHNEAPEVISKCKELGVSGVVLVIIEGFSWNDAMSPWSADALTDNGTPFAGKADDQLTILERQIIPRVEETLGIAQSVRAITGYSLAGLFALWAAFESDSFTAVASISGSLWYPGFKDYVAKHAKSNVPPYAYISLGGKESHSPIKLMRSVEVDTREIQRIIASHGSVSTFEMNLGGHFKDPALRVAKGIQWLQDKLSVTSKPIFR